MAESQAADVEAAPAPLVEDVKVQYDPWEVDMPDSDEKTWAEKSTIERIFFVSLQVGKVVAVLSLLYLFIISLGLMGSAFKVLGGPSAGAVFRNQEIFDNPIAGLVLGVLATVLVQSSSTSTSIIISMTAANLMEVKNAIPMIMGANIGTSVTNTIVSIGQMGNRNEYRRAFAGATVHDCFNMLTVMVLLPIEAITGMLRHIAAGLVAAFGITDDQDKGSKIDFLKVITKPVTSRMVQVDKDIVKSVAKATDQATLDELLKKSMIVNKQSKSTHIFMDTGMSDAVAGTLLLIISLLLLSTCLILLVKTLQSVFRGQAAIWMKSLLNLEFKSVPCIADYILIAFGAGITILMQSSSITTSTLTPLVGIGLIKLEKMFPFTVGANIGTTITGILSALAGSNIATGMTVALSHLLFNLFGTLIWFPVPFMRRVPIAMARLLGNLAADLPWFPIAYILSMFVAIPAFLFLFSLGGPAVAGIFCTLLLLLIFSLMIVIALRLNRPNVLPGFASRDYAWMPPTLMVSPPADDSAATGAVSSADLGKGGWWQGPGAWAAGWMLIALLVLGVPNSQWGNLQYTKFDSREHIGIGAWSTCSKIYEAQVDFMAPMGRCSNLQVISCLSDVATGCQSSGFSSTAGSNKVYEDSWSGCKATCTTEEWATECSRMSCGGDLHAQQCYNISKAVMRPVFMTYGVTGTPAWNDGDKCRPNTEILSNAEVLAHAGNLGVVGIVAGCIGQVLLLSYVFLNRKSDVRSSLVGSLLCFICCWIFLLASWWVFADALEQDASALIMHDSKLGAVTVNGKFKNIIENSGSFSFGYVIGAWICATIAIAIIAHRLMPPPTPPKVVEPPPELTSC